MQSLTPTVKRAHRRSLIVFGAAAALAFGIAQAQTPASAPAATAAPAATQLTIRDIYDRMEAVGYRDMREIEYSSGRYEVEARSAQGQRVRLCVNARTGAVERTRTRDWTRRSNRGAGEPGVTCKEDRP